MTSEVDVFVLNFNGEKVIEQTLLTLEQQSYWGPTKAKSPLRLIVSENGSTDQSIKVIQHFMTQSEHSIELRIRNPATPGIFSHYNLCLGESEAPYVAIFHNDDIYDSQIIQKQVEFLEQNPTLDAVLTRGSYIGAKGEPLWEATPPPGLKMPVLDARQVLESLMTGGNSFLLAPTAMFRRSSLAKLGLFALDRPLSGDVEMWLRILFKCGGLGYLNQNLFQHRLSTAQSSGKAEEGRTEPSEYFTVVDPYVALEHARLPFPPEVLGRYEALKRLDLLHTGLNLLASKKDPSQVIEQLQWFSLPENRVFARGFGIIDRVKVFGAKALTPLWRTRTGPALARWWLGRTDSRASELARLILRLKSLI